MASETQAIRKSAGTNKRVPAVGLVASTRGGTMLELRFRLGG